MSVRRIKLTFPHEMVERPIIYDLGRKFQLVTNIRRADVRQDMGWVILELDGGEDEIDQGLTWLASVGVRVDPVGGDIVEG